MKISTQTSTFANHFGYKKAVQLLCEIGYDALDLSLFEVNDPDCLLNAKDYAKQAQELKQIAADFGVCFNQAHAPFPVYQLGKDAYNEKIHPYLIRSLEIASIVGAKQIVIHPSHLPERQKEFNFDFYSKFIPYCKEYQIKIALENMFGWDDIQKRIVPNVCSTGEEFAEYMDMLDSAYFTACLDLGHAGLVGETAQNMIRTLGHNRLSALHVHDNDNVSDLHTLPFTHKLDWVEIMKALKEIHYTGELTLESDYFLDSFPKALLVPASEFMLKVGKHLISMYDNA